MSINLSSDFFRILSIHNRGGCKTLCNSVQVLVQFHRETISDANFPFHKARNNFKGIQGRYVHGNINFVYHSIYCYINLFLRYYSNAEKNVLIFQ